MLCLYVFISPMISTSRTYAPTHRDSITVDTERRFNMYKTSI